MLPQFVFEILQTKHKSLTNLEMSLSTCGFSALCVLLFREHCSNESAGKKKRFKTDSHIACRAHAASMPFHVVPLPCHALIHTRHAAPLPCSESAVSFMKVRVVAGNIRTASPTV